MRYKQKAAEAHQSPGCVASRVHARPRGAPAVTVVCGVSALKSWQRYESARYEWPLCDIGPLSVKTGSFQR